MENPIVVEDYNEDWPGRFEAFKSRLWPVVQDIAIGIEHVGSTSVPGLAAKPIIDLDIIVPSGLVPDAISRIRALGYEHRGNLGIEGREAFAEPKGSVPHHLYVCSEGALALRNHIGFRDLLRLNSDLRDTYSKLKKNLALQFAHSIEDYTKRKTEFILTVLARVGFTQEQLQEIQGANIERPVDF